MDNIRNSEAYRAIGDPMGSFGAEFRAADKALEALMVKLSRLGYEHEGESVGEMLDKLKEVRTSAFGSMDETILKEE